LERTRRREVNAFEAIVALYLEDEGYWVRQSVKVDISTEDKKYIGKFSMPTPEVDLVGLNVRENELLLVEAKSYLDSPGVHFSGVSGQNSKDAKRYKLFTDSRLREVVSRRLQDQYLNRGLITKDTKIAYGLAAGHIYFGDEPKIAKYFEKMGWRLFTPRQIKEKVEHLSKRSWEDDLVTMTAKLILKM
jgi:hypothetical protein